MFRRITWDLYATAMWTPASNNNNRTIGGKKTSLDSHLKIPENLFSSPSQFNFPKSWAIRKENFPVSGFQFKLCAGVCVHAHMLSHVWLFCNLMDCSRQAPLSMEFSRQEYWSGLPLPAPGDLQTQVSIKPTSLVFPASAGGFFTTMPPQKPNLRPLGKCLSLHLHIALWGSQYCTYPCYLHIAFME